MRHVKTAPRASAQPGPTQPPPATPPPPAPSRRAALLAATAAALPTLPAAAVQGLTAGRIPGVSATPDPEGFYTYTRPQGKSGGHGVGWSEIPPYSFRIPPGWEETPVSIADLGGTEIDLRFASPNETDGSLAVVVAPVLRFVDVGFNADVRIEELGPPDKIIAGFAPELFGAPLEQGDVTDTVVAKRGGLTYYTWVIKPLTGSTTYHLASATAYKNRVFIIAVAAKARAMRRVGGDLRAIVDSFRVKMD